MKFFLSRSSLCGNVFRFLASMRRCGLESAKLRSTRCECAVAGAVRARREEQERVSRSIAKNTKKRQKNTNKIQKEHKRNTQDTKETQKKHKRNTKKPQTVHLAFLPYFADTRAAKRSCSNAVVMASVQRSCAHGRGGE